MPGRRRARELRGLGKHRVHASRPGCLAAVRVRRSGYQWTIIDGSASFAPDAAIPPGVILTEKTVVIAGQSREAVAVTWPAGTPDWSFNTSWPQAPADSR